jgi:hypothetical protein
LPVLPNYNEQADLDLVVAYLTAQGLLAERFSKEEMRAGMTPDFRVRKDRAIVAYCEVRLRRTIIGWGAPGETQPMTDWSVF